MAPVGDSPRPTGLSKPTALAGHGRRRTWPQRAPRRRNRSCYVRTPRGPLGQHGPTSKCSTCLHLLALARRVPSRAHADWRPRLKPAFPAFSPRRAGDCASSKPRPRQRPVPQQLAPPAGRPTALRPGGAWPTRAIGCADERSTPSRYFSAAAPYTLTKEPLTARPRRALLRVVNRRGCCRSI
jgi:hypothetical protein